MLEFGGVLPGFLLYLHVDMTMREVQLFLRHVFLLGYFAASRIHKDRAKLAAEECVALSWDIMQVYGAEMYRPKQHYTQHANLTIQRYQLHTPTARDMLHVYWLIHVAYMHN